MVLPRHLLLSLDIIHMLLPEIGGDTLQREMPQALALSLALAHTPRRYTLAMPCRSARERQALHIRVCHVIALAVLRCALSVTRRLYGLPESQPETEPQRRSQEACCFMARMPALRQSSGEPSTTPAVVTVMLGMFTMPSHTPMSYAPPIW